MTKTLEQIQEENRKAIILANNPEAKDYDEALIKELKQEGCLLESARDIWDVHYSVSIHRVNNYNKNPFGTPNLKQDYVGADNTRKVGIDYNKIIGKPLDLSRVLIALDTEYLEDDKVNYFNLYDKQFNIALEKPYGEGDLDIRLYWNLTKPTLEEQTEDCQREINKLIKTND